MSDAPTQLDQHVNLSRIELTEREHTAFYIASNAGSMMTDLFHKKLKKDQKTADDFVTELDKAIEDMATHSIRQLFPNDAIYGEENGSVVGDSGYLWVIDPIDGTNNYVRGLPLCGFQMALLCNGVTELSIIRRPLTQEMYIARRGQGAIYRNALTGEESRVHVSDRPLEHAVAIFDAHVGRSDNNSSPILEILADRIAAVRVFGTAVFDLPAVASGTAEILVTGIAKPYDIAPGRLLIEEAGGVVYGVDGGTPTLSNPFMILSTPSVKDAVLEAIQQGGAQS